MRWQALHDAGFRGCVFDKVGFRGCVFDKVGSRGCVFDMVGSRAGHRFRGEQLCLQTSCPAPPHTQDNTLTTPYAPCCAPTLLPALDACRAVFGAHALVIYSNSAGLQQYDPQGG